MDIDDYQQHAWAYDQHPGEPQKGITIALLGLGGEVGTLQTSQKKLVRDGDIHIDHRSALIEDLGDILWYVADTASWLGVSLQEVATANLDKISSRWDSHDRPLPQMTSSMPMVSPPSHTDYALPPAHIFDGCYGARERLPRRLEVHLAELESMPGTVRPVVDGHTIGNRVNDNSYDPDGYRWHDAFHLAYLAVLGWSPVFRALLGHKRRSNASVDNVEDGGRAIAVEEGLSAMIFEAASRANMYAYSRVVDTSVLNICQRMVAPFEVSLCTQMEWEHAILRGCEVWRTLHAIGHGVITCDLDARTITVRPMQQEELAAHAAACAVSP
ncbi:nucleoside triphosphate pyrophosphohydrolase family protein [Rhodococcus pyridinivorans]|uniref:nucleoside triphosphate pyrophosphohydrolase family protein n=1 Tax=Rhodococcus pyridinivorans TaxID=103816 RepID=UPI001C30EBA5|nr:nucleoside triphosphate pyrophosphohydrolase family protein [Rhodococcus pyridinivorans]QXF82292.1 nucleoside triphosphate pyrophosphohydrolase family protein [Rhodococcus pyridinivorans]